MVSMYSRARSAGRSECLVIEIADGFEGLEAVLFQQKHVGRLADFSRNSVTVAACVDATRTCGEEQARGKRAIPRRTIRFVLVFRSRHLFASLVSSRFARTSEIEHSGFRFGDGRTSFPEIGAMKVRNRALRDSSRHLQGIAVFVSVVEAGSFAAAADRLGLTRSAVGKSVARL
jgi:hypothetical protein